MPCDNVRIGARYVNDETCEAMVCIAGSVPSQKNRVELWSAWPLPASGFVRVWRGTWAEFLEGWTEASNEAQAEQQELQGAGFSC